MTTTVSACAGCHYLFEADDLVGGLCLRCARVIAVSRIAAIDTEISEHWVRQRRRLTAAPAAPRPRVPRRLPISPRPPRGQIEAWVLAEMTVAGRPQSCGDLLQSDVPRKPTWPTIRRALNRLVRAGRLVRGGEWRTFPPVAGRPAGRSQWVAVYRLANP